MPTVAFAENLYSFRRTSSLISISIQPPTPTSQQLAAIDEKVTEAHNLFLGGRNQGAIDAYNQAASLIFRFLSPDFPLIAGTFPPLHPALFDPLLSLAGEWLNMLPVPSPDAVVQPRLQPDPGLLGGAAQLTAIGLGSNAFQNPAQKSAAADMSVAQRFLADGNEGAGRFFQARAQNTDPATVKLLEAGLQQPQPAPNPTGEVKINTAPAAGLLKTPLGAIHPLDATTTRLDALGRQLAGTVLTPAFSNLPASVKQGRTLGVAAEGGVKGLSWDASAGPPPLPEIRALVYESRVALKGIDSLATLTMASFYLSDVAISLPHLYYYVIPLGLAECYHALGDYQKAEAQYFSAASYAFLNPDVEAVYLFKRLAVLYLDWGNSLFRDGNAADALPIYQNVLMADGTVPSSPLYKTASLSPGATIGQNIIGNLANAAALAVNPEISATIVEIHQQLLKILGGLDFWGFFTATVPIWTFDYLQSVASNFTQLAIGAERDFINFQDRADQANLSRLQLQQQVAQGQAEVNAAQMQADAANFESQVYRDGLKLAQDRAKNARKNATEYAGTSAHAAALQAASQQVSGGDDGNTRDLNDLANQLLASGFIEGSKATIAAATQLAGSKVNQQYEVDSMNRQANELDQAAVQAQSEVAAADARLNAANAGVTVARLRAQGAQQMLDAFSNQFFTPDVWYAMATSMYRLYRRYLDMALRVARLMQQAYNFENDQSLHIVKADYATDEVKGLLAAEALLADINTFTFDLITNTTGKSQPIRQTISLAERYPFLFENQLRTTGVMEFETRMDDFDSYYPGTYAGRIEAVEVEVEGIVPVAGISGTLTNSGISTYRRPSLFPPGSAKKFRVQSRETLVLSDFNPRQDAIVATSDQRQLKVFEGAGVASSWRLELPRGVNDIDYTSLTDVRLTFTYKARFDPVLKDTVLAELAALPGVNNRQRSLPLRWLYPDAFFRFQKTGTLDFTLRAADFRRNETDPNLTGLALLLVTDGSVPSAGITLSLETPAHPAGAKAVTDAQGSIEAAPANPWNALANGATRGNYVLAVSAADNPGLVKAGVLNLTPIVNLVLILEYTYKPRV
jgi:receptor-binding and translocation channel-forming TcA subunit of Tc toxin